MRACEGCRKRKIKCDAATTNTWPCSACIRLKLHCVRPNGFDGSATDSVFDATGQSSYDTAAAVQDSFRQQVSMAPQPMLATGQKMPTAGLYAPPASYNDPNAALYQPVAFQDSGDLHYTTVPPQMGMVDPTYSTHDLFPTPPLQPTSSASPPDSFTTDPMVQGDLADLLGSLKMNEAGTGECHMRAAERQIRA
jgi:hypothetical protein